MANFLHEIKKNNWVRQHDRTCSTHVYTSKNIHTSSLVEDKSNAHMGVPTYMYITCVATCTTCTCTVHVHVHVLKN